MTRTLRHGRPPRLADVPAFRAAIASDWADADAPVPVVPGAAAAAAGHRAALGARLPGQRVVLASGTAPRRSGDTSYEFRADSDVFWLTGCAAESAVVVLEPTATGHEATLYLPPPAGPGEAGFFADPDHGELWIGPQPGLAAWSAALDLTVRPLAEPDSRAHRRSRACALSSPSLRMVKDAWEVAQLRAAVEATLAGFHAVVAEVPAAMTHARGERWLQGTFDRHARTLGNGPGYASIVASGPHAPTLHWTRCDGPILPGQALLLDLGVEVDSLYTADVTRTVPPSGRFSPVQRAVHDLVERAHRAGLAAVRPGVSFSDFHHASMEVVATGLSDWGLLPVSVDEALSPTGQHHRRYLACGVGHHLGLDVHDCLGTPREAHADGTLAPGMALTVEPGLYFHAHDLTVPPEPARRRRAPGGRPARHLHGKRGALRRAAHRRRRHRGLGAGDCRRPGALRACPPRAGPGGSVLAPRMGAVDLPVMPPVQPMLAKAVSGVPDPAKHDPLGLSLRAQVGRLPLHPVQGRRRGGAWRAATPSR
ncbi:aminopeptidase P N-terminal domain-containing protein [Nocardioides convexus]|uniref:aminopeptidase P family protein n=1 Tax=Nocardioides convexus TaxID=2712224 RepID=UPI002418A2FD|nr:aminopeptidase P N-terminal domain-containing protein [Nocardioides convexus]